MGIPAPAPGRWAAEASCPKLCHHPAMSRRFQLGLALLVLLALARYGWAIDVSFINDDFLFLERARTASFLDNWNFQDALGNVYRPLTRNLYFWLGCRLLGRDPAPYHWVNLTLVGLSL